MNRYASRPVEVPLVAVCDVHVQTFAETLGIGTSQDIVPTTAFAIKGDFAFVYEYPLTSEALIVHDIWNPTAHQVLLLGALDYQRIYDEEDETASAPPRSMGNLVNRGFSDGKYGICGHYLGDLTFVEILVYPVAREIRFSVNS